MFMKLTVNTGFWLLLLTVIIPGLNASKLTGIKVLDQGYLIVHFKDGDVKFVDEGTGSTAFAGHSSEPDNSYVVTYGEPLNIDISAKAGLWKIVSDDDTYYGTEGVPPSAVFRKTRVNGMFYTGWNPDISDHGFDYTKEHFIYLQLPSSMQQGSTYTLEIDQNLGSDVTEISITYDIFNIVSEAVHVNLVGYLINSRIKPADLYHFLGDGGNRDYSEFEGNEVFIYDLTSEEAHSVGKVAFWMESQTEDNWNLTGSGVVVGGNAARTGGGVPDQDLSLDVFINGEFVETVVMPTEFRRRKHEVYWNYELPEAGHEIRLVARDIPLGYQVNLNSLIVYSNMEPDTRTYF